jgi:Zn finger protein HypA/HybF involved in hydrogenase expression
MSRRLTTKEFISRSRKVHGRRYDYSSVEYTNSYTKVKILCRLHGIFEQIPAMHVSGQGCSACNGVKKLTTSDFVIRVRKIHGSTYTYINTVYKDNKTKVEVKCRIHGLFWIHPWSHYRGAGCPKCDGTRLDQNDFLERAKSVHGNKYDYSKVEFKTTKTKVVIICNKHGEYLQSPEKHLGGQGCEECGRREFPLLILRYDETDTLKKDVKAFVKKLRYMP